MHTESEAERTKNGLIAGDRVLVHGHVAELERVLDGRPVDAQRAQVDKEQVVLAAAGEDGVAARDERGAECFAVAHDLLLVLDKLRTHRLAERHRHRSDVVVVRPTYKYRQTCSVSRDTNKIQYSTGIRVFKADKKDIFRKNRSCDRSFENSFIFLRSPATLKYWSISPERNHLVIRTIRYGYLMKDKYAMHSN